MKKVFYSFYTKIIISTLCIVSILCALTVGLDGLKMWDDYKVEVYMLEDNFEESTFMSNMLNFASNDLYNSAIYYIRNNSFQVQEYIDNNIDGGHMDYYLKINEKLYSNMSNLNAKHDYYYKLEIDKDGNKNQEIYPNEIFYYVDTSEVSGYNIQIYIGLKNEYVSNCQEIWNEQRLLVNETIINVTYWLLFTIACVVYLICVTGKDEKGNKETYAIDKMFTEVKLFILGFTYLIGYCSFYSIINQYFYGNFPYELMKLFIQIIVGFISIVTLTALLSMIRNIKNSKIGSSTLVSIVILKIIKVIKNIINEIKMIFVNNTILIILGILFVYTAIIGYFGNESYHNSIFVLYGIFIFIVLGYSVMKYLTDLNKIKEGVNKITNGEIDYKIEHVNYKDLSILKDQINDISSGLQASVNRTLKAERLKTELITNVSHDLKTPLTSIINYTKLLSNVEGLPEEAKDYVAIIDKKSQRLKALTQDLFDISKVQSGNEEIKIEKLNINTLISQSLAEYEKELENLTICTNVEEDLYIYSDGRKMSRVINNLLINISKYTMKSTRVFINAYSNQDKVFIEMKNISSYPLDFDKDEIMQRFRRGDESRTEEGHGLGLAIVKSYVEVTGGKFDIILDGDMFKVVIEYDKK